MVAQLSSHVTPLALDADVDTGPLEADAGAEASLDEVLAPAPAPTLVEPPCPPAPSGVPPHAEDAAIAQNTPEKSRDEACTIELVPSYEPQSILRKNRSADSIRPESAQNAGCGAANRENAPQISLGDMKFRVDSRLGCGLPEQRTRARAHDLVERRDHRVAQVARR